MNDPTPMPEVTPLSLATGESADNGKTAKGPVLEVRNLTRRFGSLIAVKEVSFQAFPGQVVGFIGPNGAGKTTTMRILATLDVPNNGDAFVCGHSVIDHPDKVRKRLGYMPDSFGKYANMDVVDYLDFFARAYGLSGAQRKEAVEHVLVFTELRRLATKPVKSLSKGMSQRLGLGRTLIHDPEVLVLDEPAAGLDPRARVELRELVNLLAKELNKTVLISSHILTELGEICDSVIIIEAGEILASGSIAEIQRRQRETRSLTDARPLTIHLATADQALLETVHRWLVEQPFVVGCSQAEHRFTVEFKGDAEQQIALIRRMFDNNFPVAEFHGKLETLEDAFMNITKGILQ